MGRIAGNTGGLYIAGETRFNPDAPVGQYIQQGGILYGVEAVTDPFGTQKVEGLPDGFRTGDLTRMNGDMPAGIPGAAEMILEQAGRKKGFVPGQV